MKKKFIISTKNDKVLIEAEDRDHAFAKYFYGIINEKVTLDKLGGIIMLTGEHTKDGEEIGFRTAPLLWKMGIIGTQTAIKNICSCTGVTHTEAKMMLKNAADADGARLIPLIEELRLAEGEEDTIVDGNRRGMQK